MKNEENRKVLLEQLRKTPVVQVACQKAGVSRATYYRWRKQSKAFTQDADAALLEGILLINDMAESQLVSAIREKNFPAIRFWLQNHHSVYASKVEVTAKLAGEDKKLTKGQKALIRQALKFAAVVSDESVTSTKQKDHDSNKAKE